MSAGPTGPRPATTGGAAAGGGTGRPTLAIAICTFRREQVLVETLAQVLACAPAPDEVVVVDQTPIHEPETEAYLRRESEAGRIKWVRQDRPSLCAARNRAVLETTSDVVLYLDDDVILGHGCVERHRSAYRDPSVAAAVQDIEAPFPERSGVFPPAQADRPTRDVDYLRGFNFSVRRDAFVRAGGFDENLVGSVYRDESDFAMRLVAGGYRIVADPMVNVIHLLSPAGGCRIPGNRAHPEWTKSVNFFIYGFRHERGAKLLNEVRTALRSGPLRRENVVRPWRWPWAWLSFFYGAGVGFRRARHGVRSPFAPPAAAAK